MIKQVILRGTSEVLEIPQKIDFPLNLDFSLLLPKFIEEVRKQQWHNCEHQFNDTIFFEYSADAYLILLYCKWDNLLEESIRSQIQTKT